MSKCWVRSVLWIGNLHRRLLAVFFQVVGPQLSYRLTGYGARTLYRLLDPFRVRSEAQCRAALCGRVPDVSILHIAEQSFVNRARTIEIFSDLPRPIGSVGI